MADDSHKRLPSAILATVAYADIFDYPLTPAEIHRYLTGIFVEFEIVRDALKNINEIVQTGEYFTLPGREEIIPVREQREAHSRKLLRRAIHYGRILGSLPFIRMVALTGSLAVLNVSKTDDFDYMLVVTPGRVWTGRAFALLLNRFVKRLGHTLCPNLIVSRNRLEWPLHDLYSARELCQMIPISGVDVYYELMNANAWARDFLPNAFSTNGAISRKEPEKPSLLQRTTESLLRGSLGDRFEKWEMTRKIDRFSRQEGFGEETIFTAEVCQGNFHHHRKWTHEAYQQRLKKLRAFVPLPNGERVGERSL